MAKRREPDLWDSLSTASGDNPATTRRRTTRPRVGVVVPVFKHSLFLAEAVQSIQDQIADFDIVTVIVDDGCPFVETAVMGASLAMAFDNVIYLRKPNGGLSSARNFGIDHLLVRYPSIEAIYFLDADNRVSPTTLSSCMELLDPRAGIGWVYPNVDKFGSEWNGNYTGPYSQLVHLLFDNICEAGSLVSRSVFDAGIRYDETMKQGCEDWEFWLQCLSHGFTGRNNPHFGFEYRLRGESMVSDTARDIGPIRQYMFKKHPTLFTAENLMRLENQEAPRFLTISPPTDQAELFTDPTASRTAITHDGIFAYLYRQHFEPDSYCVPETVVWLRKELLDALSQTNIIWTIFYNLEKLLADANFLCLRFLASADEVSIEAKDVGADHPMPRRVHGWVTSRELLQNCILDRSRDWVRSLADAQPSPKVIDVVVRVPVKEAFLARYTLPLPLSILATIDLADELDLKLEPQPRWSWRTAYYPVARQRQQLLEQHLSAERLTPMIRKRNRRQIGIALPIAAYGGVERVAFAVAAAIRDLDCDVHLFCFGPPGVKTYKGQAGLFRSINFFNEKGYSLWGGSRPFMGHELRMEWDEAARTRRVLGFLGPLDVLINCQVAPLNAVLGTIRRQGVKTIAHTHVIDQTPQGRQVGHTYLTLGFEHAHDLILTCSDALRNWFHGMGVPADKLMHIPNAGAYTPSGYRAEAERDARRRGRSPGPLKVLFAGRLDAQKGVERLLDAVQLCQARDIPVTWRLVGSELINAGQRGRWADRFAALGIRVEPPIYDPDQLSEVYRGADVLVMTSRWEGAPLAIIEAQRFGCVPVATNVGAVSELISDGVDGLLVQDGDDLEVAESLVGHLGRLAADRGVLANLSDAGISRAARTNWESSCAPLLKKLVEWFPDLQGSGGDARRAGQR